MEYNAKSSISGAIRITGFENQNQLKDTIERNIYYLDNYEDITPEFARMARDYYDEKNQDWIDKYQPQRIENEVDKL